MIRLVQIRAVGVVAVVSAVVLWSRTVLKLKHGSVAEVELKPTL